MLMHKGCGKKCRLLLDEWIFAKSSLHFDL